MGGIPSTDLCGPYSYVGPAAKEGSITRVIPRMQEHFTISVTFNVLKIDQTKEFEQNTFILVIDNNPI